MKYLVLSLSVLVAATCVCAQKRPTFARYSAKVEKINNVKVKLSSKDARMFRTNLREAAKGGVNFAGRYILTGWGCGTNCEVLAIIDARTGIAYFPKELSGVGIGFCDGPGGDVASDAPAESDTLAGVYYKQDSRLLVLQGFKGGDLNRKNSGCGNYYWEWTGNRLKQVAFVPGKRTDTP